MRADAKVTNYLASQIVAATGNMKPSMLPAAPGK
jgi:hypothetical protein